MRVSGAFGMTFYCLHNLETTSPTPGSDIADGIQRPSYTRAGSMPARQRYDHSVQDAPWRQYLRVAITNT